MDKQGKHLRKGLLVVVTLVLALMGVSSAAAQSLSGERATAALHQVDLKTRVKANGNADAETATPEPTYTASPTPTPMLASSTPMSTSTSPSPTATAPSDCPAALDFAAIRKQLNKQGKDLAYVKIGFHVSQLDTRSQLLHWEQCLNGAGVPFVLKAVDLESAAMEAAQNAALYGVADTIVYRKDGGDASWRVPYPDPWPSPTPDPQQAAIDHWNRHVATYSDNVDPNGNRLPDIDSHKDRIWVETIQEPRREITEWLAEFSLKTAQLANAAGYKYAAFSWASGDPDTITWNGPKMLEFLDYASHHRDQVAIALHEYKGQSATFQESYPVRIGRFQNIYNVTDAHGWPRPTIIVTEFGYGESAIGEDFVSNPANVPWAGGMYAHGENAPGMPPYPQNYDRLLGATTRGSGSIGWAIAGMETFALQHYYEVPLATAPPSSPTPLSPTLTYSPTPEPPTLTPSPSPVPPTATRTRTPTRTPNPTRTPKPSWTPTRTRTATSTRTPTATATETPTASPTGTATPTSLPPTATSTWTPSVTPLPPTWTPSPTLEPPTWTPSPTQVPPTATFTWTPSATALRPTWTPSPTPEPPTWTPSPTQVPPTATYTWTPSATPLPPTWTPSRTPEPATWTPSPTQVPPTKTPTRTPNPTHTPRPSRTPTRTRTATPTWTPTATSTETPTTSPTATSTGTTTVTATWTPTATATWTPSATATRTPTATATWTPSATATWTVTATSTRTPTGTFTRTPTATASWTATATTTWTPSATATWTVTPTSTRTPTGTFTRTPTATASWTATATASWTATATASWTPTASPSRTPSSTPLPPPPPGENVARTAIGWTASSVYGTAYGGDKAYDGVLSVASKWTSIGSTRESWLALDLGQARVITGFVVRHAGSAGELKAFNTQMFRLETGDSLGGPWTVQTSVDNTSQQNVSIAVLDAPVSARTVRLYVTDAGIDNYARIAELEVYSTGAGTPKSCPAGQYLAEYFGGTAPAGPLLWTACEASVSYDWATAGPGNGVPNDSFSVRWTGRFPFEAANYEFVGRSDDGIRIWVDEVLVVDAWRDQSYSEARGTRRMTAGEHVVKVEYYEHLGNAAAQVLWEGPSCNTGEFLTEYFNNISLSGNPVFSQCESAINNDWQTGSPGNGIPIDYFSVRWTGDFTFEDGVYTFIGGSDDGIRIWVDGAPVVDAWLNRSYYENRGTRTMTAGEHEVKVEYYEHKALAIVQVRWEKGNAPPLLTGWEDAHPLGYANRIEYVRSVAGYNNSSNPPPEATRVTQEGPPMAPNGGSYYLRVAGYSQASYSYVFFRLFDTNIPIQTGMKLRFWIYPQQRSTFAIDGHFTDGNTMRDLYNGDFLKDQNGVRIHPGVRGVYAVGQWHAIEVDLSQAAGKTLDYLMVAFDNGSDGYLGPVRAYFDNVSIGP